jgi:hypothetical protein
LAASAFVSVVAALLDDPEPTHQLLDGHGGEIHQALDGPGQLLVLLGDDVEELQEHLLIVDWISEHCELVDETLQLHGKVID